MSGTQTLLRVVQGSTQDTSREDTPPFRRAHRAAVSTEAELVDPGHPGRARFLVLDLSEDGLFVADELCTLSAGSRVRVGLPSYTGDVSVWAWGAVLWRGRKSGRSGVGVALSFDSPEVQAQWGWLVQEWTQSQTPDCAPVVRLYSHRQVTPSPRPTRVSA